MEPFDVIVVGARCAGSPLGALLARRGLRVAVVEQTTFPRDTLSTHLIHAQALAFLERLGVMAKIRATGAPIVGRFDARQEDLEYVPAVPQQPGDAGGLVSVRRTLLDPSTPTVSDVHDAPCRIAGSDFDQRLFQEESP